MDKVQKFEYTQQIEQYLEDQQVYELFEGLLKQLLVNKPDKPLDFLISKLQQEPIRRIFLMGPPGSFRQENAIYLADQFGWECITVGDLLRREVQQKSEMGKQIQEAFKEYQYVDDSIVIDLVQNEIRSCEEAQKSWIIQGFPRTKVQALALQKIGVLPDKFIHLNVKKSASLARIKNNLIAINQSLYGPELEDLASSCLQEYQINMKGVREAFNQFILDHSAEDKAQADVAAELQRMLKLRFTNNSPKRPPRIIIVGPPGSGRETQAKLVAEQFGLVHISIKQILKNEIQKSPDAGKVIVQCMQSGEMVPDNIINYHVEKRLKQSDCKVNGWVLEGFPYSRAQINMLKAMRIKPSNVFIFEQNEDECVRRLGNKRVDPNTGIVYNLEVNPPSDEATSNRLIQRPEDSEEVVRKRCGQWKQQVLLLEEHLRQNAQTIQSERTIEELSDMLGDAIQNPS